MLDGLRTILARLIVRHLHYPRPLVIRAWLSSSAKLRRTGRVRAFSFEIGMANSGSCSGA
jgi:hypothetical protein